MSNHLQVNGWQMVVNPYSGILPCNKKEQTMDIQHVDKSQNNYPEYKKLDKKREHTVGFHLWKTQGSVTADPVVVWEWE